MTLSRRTFDEKKRYETVVFQENTHPADFEVVELQDIQNSERRALITNLLTDGAIGDGFKIVGSGLPNAVNVTLGTVLSQGDRLVMPDVEHVAVLSQFVFNMPTATPVVDRTDLIYLDISVENVTSAQDPDIEDPTLGPSAYRERVAYAIKLAIGTTAIPALPSGHRGMALATIGRHANIAAVNAADVSDARPLAVLSNRFSPKNLITVSATGAQFNDVQKALDSIVGSSQSNPFTVLVGPGTYVSNVPITLSKPYVELIGYDREATTIRVLQPTGSFQAFTISADHVAITNLGLDIGTGSAGNATVLAVNSGVQAARVAGCLIGQQFFSESLVNNVQGVSVLSGASLSIFDSSVWASNFGFGISNAGGTITIFDSSITALNVDAISNSGTLTLTGSNALSNNRSLNSIGAVFASFSSFKTGVVQAQAVSGSNCIVLSGSVLNKMRNCVIESTINRIDVTGSTLDWSGVDCAQSAIFITGAGGSIIARSTLSAVEASGATIEFIDCSIIGGSNGSEIVGLAIRNGSISKITSCINTGNNAVVADNASPVISGCSFRSVGAINIVRILNGAKPIIASSTFFVTDSAAARAINIEDTASNPTLVYDFFQGPMSGPLPPVFVDGVVGSQLLRGQNTGSQGVTLFSANITTTNLLATGSRHIDLTDMPDLTGTNIDHDTRYSIGAGGGAGSAHNKAVLASTTSGQGAALVGVEIGTNLVATNVQGALQEVKGELINARGTAADLATRLATSMTPGGYILQVGMENLRVHATSPVSNQVSVSAGDFQKTDGSATVYTSLALSSIFTPVLTLGQSRIDLLSIDNTGALTITQGVQSGSPVVPAYPTAAIVLAEITVVFGSPAAISDANIKDARPFLRALPPLITQVGNLVKSGLIVKSDATTPDSIVNIIADIMSVQGVVIGDGTPASISLSADVTATGANGRDPAHSVTPSTWYGIFLISNSNGTLYASYLVRDSEIASLPSNLPAGYTLFRRVGWARSTAAGAFPFLHFTSIGRDIYYDTSVAAPAFGAGTSLVTSMPPTSQIAHVAAETSTGPGAADALSKPTGSAMSPVKFLRATNLNGSGTVTVNTRTTLQTSTSQSIDFSGSGTSVNIIGYVDEV